MTVERKNGVNLLELEPYLAGSGADVIETQMNVRRMLYGLTRKKDEYCYLSVWRRAFGEETVPLSLLDQAAPGGASYATHNFLFQSFSEQRQERAQIIETFGDPYVFFYGERPVVLQIQGVLVNTYDFNWKNEWWENYNRFLRGTRCVENRARVVMGMDGSLYEGYILGAQCSQSAQEIPYLCPFGFSFLVTRYTRIATALSGDVVTSADGQNAWAGSGVDVPSGRTVRSTSAPGRCSRRRCGWLMG